MDTEEKNSIKFWVIIILLIIIILILLFFRRFGFIDNNNNGTPTTADIDTRYEIPTGNVDVFDIDLNCNCDNLLSGRIYIDDAKGDYVDHKYLRIFSNAAFQFKERIAPGVGNVYHFVVHNSTNINLKYNMEMVEESEYKINMKYRLKRNNRYIIGDEDTWVTASELKTKFLSLAIGNSDSYSLEWYWFDDDIYDTIAGEEMESLYKLKTKFYFEQVMN